MIWHFFEVWVLMLAAFAIGCPLGALAYRLIAGSPLAELQGSLADVVGDIVDDLKRRLGIGPDWRPDRRRIIERPMADGTGGEGDQRIEPVFLPATAGPLMIADQSGDPGPRDAGDDRAVRIVPAIVYDEADETAVTDDVAVARPVGLASPRNGVPDDLQRIRGIGRRIERRLNAFGIYHFGQIAAWTPAEMRWVARQLSFPERIEWDDWIGQAVILASGGDTGFVKSADRRRRARRERALETELARALDGDVEDRDAAEADATVLDDFEADEALWDEPLEGDADEADGDVAADAVEADTAGEGDAPAAAEGEGKGDGEDAGSAPAGESPEEPDSGEAADPRSAEGEAVAAGPEVEGAAGDESRKDRSTAAADPSEDKTA